jgi:hypothetical protein
MEYNLWEANICSASQRIAPGVSLWGSKQPLGPCVTHCVRSMHFAVIFFNFVQLPNERTTPFRLPATPLSLNDHLNALLWTKIVTCSYWRVFDSARQTNLLRNSSCSMCEIGAWFKLSLADSVTGPICVVFSGRKIIYTVHTLYYTDPGGCAVLGVGLRPRDCWGRGFESRWGHGCLSLVSVVCCQVEVSATSWSFVQRSPKECCVCVCVCVCVCEIVNPR